MPCVCLLRHHGLSTISVNDVLRATAVLAKVLYCASAWSDFCSAADSERRDVFVRRCKRLHYNDEDIPAVEEMFVNADAALFSRVLGNDKRVLQHYLPDRCQTNYSLRPQQHSKQLIPKTTEFYNREYMIIHRADVVQRALHIDVNLHSYKHHLSSKRIAISL